LVARWALFYTYPTPAKPSKCIISAPALTTAEKVYWAPIEGGEYVYLGEMDKILITVTALDKEGKATACGTAAVEHNPVDGWFKFTGEVAASSSLDERFDPVPVIKDELAASGNK
jgi:hypothetical protein